MSRKHQSPEYQRNRNIVRKRVAALHRSGQPAVCWRGGGAIVAGMPYDVGHRTGARGHALSDLAPEHRHRQPGCCDGNRAEGARVGAIVTRRARVTHQAAREVTTWKL